MSTIFEKSVPGRIGYRLPEADVPTEPIESLIPESLLRKEAPDLPESSQIEVIRHYTGLSKMNYGVEDGFYPLGSCTMKYNPKINEDMARLPGFAAAHAWQGEDLSQGSLELMYELGEMLRQIAGMDAITLQPAAGSQGELVGMLLIRKALEKRGELGKRTKIFLPDSAHGTNPASAVICGFDVVETASNKRGKVDVEALRANVDESVAGFMLTNPNTLGLFEEDILEITQIIHDAGGYCYMDGANLNAILGHARPGDMGFDIVHYNLHKTFSTPHGGGGPGSGPVSVVEELAPYLPVPLAVKNDDGTYGLDFDRPDNIGKVQAFHGSFGMLIRAYTYIRMLGSDGLKSVADHAVLHANYIKEKLKDTFKLPYDEICMHEVVFSGRGAVEGAHTTDIAKRLLDYGIHPSSIYFPLIVPEAMMIEPTETVSKEELDEFIDALKAIVEEGKKDVNILLDAPHTTPVRRLDDVKAAKELVLRA